MINGTTASWHNAAADLREDEWIQRTDLVAELNARRNGGTKHLNVRETDNAGARTRDCGKDCRYVSRESCDATE
jgi:hypothetical protein